MSAVLQEKPLETIYDHGVTDAEILLLYDGYPETREEHFEVTNQDSEYVILYKLYLLRGNPDKALSFLERVQDNHLKIQFKMRPCCAVHS